MSKSSSLNLDVHKLLDLLLRKFELHSKPNGQNALSICVFPGDLDKVKLGYDSFGEALYVIRKHEPQIKFPLLDDTEEYNERAYTSNRPEPIVEGELPANFIELAEKLEQQFPLEKQHDVVKIHITYHMGIGKFVFNGDERKSFKLEHKQKDTADCLVEHGVNVAVSWDVIYDTFKDVVGDLDFKDQDKQDAKKRSVSTAVNAINVRAHPYLESDKDLIDRKDNTYWLQYEVDKGR